MIDCECRCCQELFTPNAYHPEQQFCWKAGCRKASHAAANRKWRECLRRDDPLRESQVKSRARKRQRMQLCRELGDWRKRLARCQMLLLGVLSLLAGRTGGNDLAETMSRCLDAGRELLREGAALWEDWREKSCPGSGFAEHESRDMATTTCC